VRPRHHGHLLDVVHAEGRALIPGTSHSLAYEVPVAGYWRPAEAGIAGERAAEEIERDVELTALPQDTFGITVDDAEGASFRVPLNR
jgi:hypothetical protein